MIYANELRLNNWIWIDNGEKPKYKYQVSGHDIDEIDGNGTDCFPIELTKKWVIDFGFQKYQWQDAWFKKTDFGDLYIHFYKEKVIVKIVKVSKDSQGQKMFSLPFIGNKKSTDEILFVHQLQNLYFFLTKEELELEVVANGS